MISNARKLVKLIVKFYEYLILTKHYYHQIENRYLQFLNIVNIVIIYLSVKAYSA